MELLKDALIEVARQKPEWYHLLRLDVENIMFDAGLDNVRFIYTPQYMSVLQPCESVWKSGKDCTKLCYHARRGADELLKIVERCMFYGGSYKHKDDMPECECKEITKEEINRHIVHASVKVANNWGQKMFDDPDWDLFSHNVPEEFDPKVDPAFVDKDWEFETSVNDDADIPAALDPSQI